MKKLAISVRQHVAPLQANEVTVLRKKCAVFDVEQHKFRERFRKEAPFRLEPNCFPIAVKGWKTCVLVIGSSCWTSTHQCLGILLMYRKNIVITNEV